MRNKRKQENVLEGTIVLLVGPYLVASANCAEEARFGSQFDVPVEIAA